MWQRPKKGISGVLCMRQELERMQRQSPHPAAASPSPQRRAQPGPAPPPAATLGLAPADAPGRVLGGPSQSEDALGQGSGSIAQPPGQRPGSLGKSLGLVQDPSGALTRPGAEVHVSAAHVPIKALLKGGPEAGSNRVPGPACQGAAQAGTPATSACASPSPGPAALCNGSTHLEPAV